MLTSHFDTISLDIVLFLCYNARNHGESSVLRSDRLVGQALSGLQVEGAERPLSKSRERFLSRLFATDIISQLLFLDSVPPAMTDDEIPPSLWTVKHVAAYLTCSKGTIYRMVHQQRIPHVKLGGSLRFRRVEIDEWIANNRRGKVN